MHGATLKIVIYYSGDSDLVRFGPLRCHIHTPNEKYLIICRLKSERQQNPSLNI